MAGATLRFLYIYCNDVDAMRQFYSEVIGLQEMYYFPGAEGGLAYQCDELQFTILPAPGALPTPSEWHQQPGWQGGTLPAASWSIVSESHELFAAILTRLAQARALTFFDSPQWLGYWSFPVKDPMGNTVELTLPMESEPENKTWSS